MLQTVTITSKRQISIPVKIFNKLGLVKGDKLIINLQQDKIVMQKAQSLLDEIAGTVKLPAKYKNKSLDEIIKLAKKEYFKSRQ